MTEKKFGTREWAEVNKNIYIGCPHDCRYCYARYNAVTRYHRLPSADAWKTPMLHEKNFNETPKTYYDMRIMFPTQHDITPENVDKCIEYLTRWLEKGNEVLIVSKPHLDVTKKLCDSLSKYKDQIVFRFTIGSVDDAVLRFWEPGAPGYMERLLSLKYAYDKGFVTSVSCEPMLDEHITLLVKTLLPFITDTIWIGKMNHIKQRVDQTGWGVKEFAFLKKVIVANIDGFISDLYDEFKDNPKVKWKESIKSVLGLPDEDGVA